IAFNAVNAAWHLPVFYQAVLLHHWIHVVQHIVLVFTALMMWWPILSPSRELPRLPYGAQTLYIFLLLLLQLPVFAPIIFSESLFYEFYVAAPDMWGLEPLADQQLAGAVMQLGGMTVMVIFMGRAFFRWARQESSPGLRSRSSEGAYQPRHENAAKRGSSPPASPLYNEIAAGSFARPSLGGDGEVRGRLFYLL